MIGVSSLKLDSMGRFGDAHGPTPCERYARGVLGEESDDDK